MSYKPTIKDIIIGILLIALFAQIYQSNTYRNDLDGIRSEKAFQDSKIDSIKNKYNQIVVEKRVVETSNTEIIKNLSDKIFNLEKRDEKRIKQVNALITAIQNAKIDTIEIPYTDTVRVYPPGTLVNVDSVVIPPRHFKDSTKDHVIDGTVLLKGVRINSIYLPDSSSFRIAEQSPKGFFNRIIKPNQTVIQNIHTSKYYETVGLQAITIKHKPNAWQKWIKPLLFSTATGIFTYKVLK